MQVIIMKPLWQVNDKSGGERGDGCSLKTSCMTLHIQQLLVPPTLGNISTFQLCAILIQLSPQHKGIMSYAENLELITLITIRCQTSGGGGGGGGGGNEF